jgi:hypothetical protein
MLLKSRSALLGQYLLWRPVAAGCSLQAMQPGRTDCFRIGLSEAAADHYCVLSTPQFAATLRNTHVLDMLPNKPQPKMSVAPQDSGA